MADVYRNSIMKNIAPGVESPPITDATQKEHLMLSQYYIDWHWVQTKRFKANYTHERDQAMHSAIQYLLGITTLGEFIEKYRKPQVVETWCGEKLTSQIIGVLENVIIIVIALGFKGITDTAEVTLPTTEEDRKSLMATIITRLGAGVTHDGAKGVVEKMSWKSFIDRLNVYMRTICDIEYTYNKRTNTMTQHISDKWQVMTDSEGDLIVKPRDTPYNPEFRLHYRQRYVDQYNTLLFDDLSQITLSDIGLNPQQYMPPDQDLAQTIINIAKSNV